jgi:hypothetical protein
MARINPSCVMAGLVPAIHVFDLVQKDEDARAKRGPDIQLGHSALEIACQGEPVMPGSRHRQN